MSVAFNFLDFRDVGCPDMWGKLVFGGKLNISEQRAIPNITVNELYEQSPDGRFSLNNGICRIIFQNPIYDGDISQLNRMYF